jgi:hypothetical protein
MTGPCQSPAVIHPGTPLWECVDSTCELPREEHHEWLPCRWAWPYAHGRVYGGTPFPKGLCPQCRHIRRAGHPKVELDPSNNQRRQA